MIGLPFSTWDVATIARGATVSRFSLRDERGMECVIEVTRLDRHPVIRYRLVARFTHPNHEDVYQAHAKADAARLLAMIFDTIGDLGRDPDDRVDVMDPTLVIDRAAARVELTGNDAPFVIAPFFGDDVADALTGSPLFERQQPRQEI